MRKSEFMHRFRQRARNARPYNIAEKSERTLYRRTRRGAHCASAFCAESAFCSIIVNYHCFNKIMPRIMTRNYTCAPRISCTSKKASSNILSNDLVRFLYSEPPLRQLRFFASLAKATGNPSRYSFSSGSIAGMPRCSTGVEKTICVRVLPNRCSWLMN